MATPRRPPARLNETEVVIPVRVGEEGKIFGTITTQQIADELAAQGVTVDRRKISLSEDVRETGVYPATGPHPPGVQRRGEGSRRRDRGVRLGHPRRPIVRGALSRGSPHLYPGVPQASIS